jgi:hypothetical protein
MCDMSDLWLLFEFNHCVLQFIITYNILSIILLSKFYFNRHNLR